MMRIAIIGAGISGLTLASCLKDFAEVTVFEKARGVGGRMSTRYADSFCFDHGAQCFTARTKAFQAFLNPYIESGIISEWTGKVINLQIGQKPTRRIWSEPHLVASPHMNSLCKVMARDLNINLSTEITSVENRAGNSWYIKSQDKQHGIFDWIISTAPPVQTINLLGSYLPEQALLHTVKMQSCYATMIGLNKAWEQEWIAAKVHNNPIKWISVNSTKPNRNKMLTTFVAHSRNAWSEKYVNNDVKEIEKILLAEFQHLTGIAHTDADYIATHLWKYAIVSHTHKSGFYLDETKKIAATSDWASTSRIEEVWINAMELVKVILNK